MNTYIIAVSRLGKHWRTIQQVAATALDAITVAEDILFPPPKDDKGNVLPREHWTGYEFEARQIS